MSVDISYPMPPVPEPPRLGPDPRQQRTSRVVSGLLNQREQPEPEPGPPVRTGFPAAAVDLGALQGVIEDGLRELSWPEILQHWADVERWLGQCTRAWVQRCKSKRFALGEHGIEIALETQDDYGYYQYVFDVFPGSRREGPQR